MDWVEIGYPSAGGPEPWNKQRPRKRERAAMDGSQRMAIPSVARCAWAERGRGRSLVDEKMEKREE